MYDLAGSPSQIVETRVKPNDIVQDEKTEPKIKDAKEEDMLNLNSKEPQVFLDFQTEEKAPSSSERQKFRAHYSNSPGKPNFPYQYQNPYEMEELKTQQNASDASNLTTSSTTEGTMPPSIQWKTKDTSFTSKPMKLGTFRTALKGTNNRKPLYSEVPLVMQNKPHIPDVTMKTILRPLNRPTQLTTLKKPYYRPLVKIQSRPVRMPTPHFYPKSVKVLQEVVVLKPHMVMNKPFPSNNLQQKPLQLKDHVIPKPPEVHNVELSLPQASTEKEPTLTKHSKPYASLVSVKPDKEPYTLKMRPAVNTGFKPESIVIEGGFKPIISKDLEDRNDDEAGPELEYESEIGVIDVANENKELKPAETLEPVFIPSPMAKQTRKPMKMRKRANPKKSTVLLIIKQGRSLDDRQDEDEIAEAAERVDAYYLPPPDKKIKATEISKKPLDIDIPPGTVVTYDGRKVSGASLTAKIADRGSVINNRASKATELIKAGPQFAPFKGPLPPLDPRYMNTDVPQLQSQGVISRELDAPALTRATRLSLIKQLEEIEDANGRRKKRDAHHTPEHTAEQQRNRNDTENSTRSDANRSRVTFCTSVVLVICLVKLF